MNNDLTTFRTKYKQKYNLNYSDACAIMYGIIDVHEHHLEGIYTGDITEIDHYKNNYNKLDTFENKSKYIEEIIYKNNIPEDILLQIQNKQNDNDKPKRIYLNRDIFDVDTIKKDIYKNGKGVNCEHIWVQSQLKKCEAIEAVSDLHHMIPANVKVNGVRSNHIFGEVDDDIAILYGNDENDKNDNNDHDIKSEFDKKKKIFEPREISKGNVARALFYIATIYGDKLFSNQKHIDWFEKMRPTLLEWNKIDPPDTVEIERTKLIEKIQGNVNPFIIDNSLVDKYFNSNKSYI